MVLEDGGVKMMTLKMTLRTLMISMKGVMAAAVMMTRMRKRKKMVTATTMKKLKRRTLAINLAPFAYDRGPGVDWTGCIVGCRGRTHLPILPCRECMPARIASWTMIGGPVSTHAADAEAAAHISVGSGTWSLRYRKHAA